MRARLLAVAGASLFVAGAAGPAQAALAPGLFGGHPPAGRVLSDDTLTLPPGRAHGVVLVIHGGAWVLTGPKTLAAQARNVRWFTRLGWAVDNIDYRPGWLSVVDVVAAYDQLRGVYPHAPICAYGESAGGQLAMLLAASRRSLRCVISAAGLTDLTTIPRGSPLHTLLMHAFHGHPWEFSPVRLAARIRGRLLCVGSSLDQVVPEPEQLGAIKLARPATRVILLAGAPTPGGPSFAHPPNFVHASITAAAALQYRRAVRRMLHAVAGG